MRRLFTFLSVVLGGLILSVSCKVIESPYVNPQIIGSSSILSPQQISHIKEGKEFSGFLIEFKDDLRIQESGDYADKQYQSLKKSYNAKEREVVLYVLFDRTNDFMIVKGPLFTMNMIKASNRSRLYKLQMNEHADPFKALCELSQLRTRAQDEFLEKGLFQRLGIVNPLLSVIDLATDYVAPSDSFWHKFFFHVPFGASLMVFERGVSFQSAALFLIMLYIISFMGMLVKKDSKSRFSFFWIIQGMFYVLTIVCMFNVFYPSFEVAYGMQAFGYSDAFEQIIGPYYDGFVDTPGRASGWLVGLLLITLISRQLIERNFDVSSVILAVFFGTGAAVLCNEMLLMLIIGYFLSEIIGNWYLHLYKGVSARVADGMGSSLPQAIIVTLGSAMILLLPVVSLALIGVSVLEMGSSSPLKTVLYAGIPTVVVIIVYIFDRD